MRPVPEVTVLAHSAIRIQGPKTVYVDPFHLTAAPHDADLICVTHDHYDHLSPDDIARVAGPDTWFALPETCLEAARKAGLPEERLLLMSPGEHLTWQGIVIEAVPAYNVGKQFHTQDKAWLGYVIEMLGRRYYIAGDTDDNEDVRRVRCHVALLPVGGKYTMTAEEAAALANAIRPGVAVPTHYGDIVGQSRDAETFARLLDPRIRCDFGK
nr:MBL fold metallo-hydrolase [Lachnospiraceae bacterium]